MVVTVEVTTAGVRQWCDDVGYNFQTINNRLSNYKSGRGKFNLVSAEAVKVLEESYNLPGPECVPTVVTEGVKVEAVEYNSLVPVATMTSMCHSVTSKMSRLFSSLRSSTLCLSLVSVVTARHTVLNRHVHNSTVIWCVSMSLLRLMKMILIGGFPSRQW